MTHKFKDMHAQTVSLLFRACYGPHSNDGNVYSENVSYSANSL